MVKKRHHFIQNLIVSQLYTPLTFQKKLLKSLLTNYELEPMVRFRSLLIIKNSINSLGFYASTQTRLQCKFSIMKRVPSHKFLASRFFFVKHADDLIFCSLRT